MENKLYIECKILPKTEGSYLTNLGLLHFSSGIWSYDEACKHIINKDSVEYYLKQITKEEL